MRLNTSADVAFGLATRGHSILVCRILASISRLRLRFQEREENVGKSWQTKCRLDPAFYRDSAEGETVKDIDLVLRNKRVQLAELALEINGLEAAATALRSVVHLLAEDIPPKTQANSTGHIALTEEPPSSVGEDSRTAAPERSRVRRWCKRTTAAKISRTAHSIVLINC